MEANREGNADATTTQLAQRERELLAARRISVPGTLVLGRYFTDRDGEHVLALTRKAGPSPSAPASGRIEHIALLAALHTRGPDGAWRHIILRQGPLKLAIRGEEEIRLPNGVLGGEHAHDNALLAPRNAAFERHLDAIWNKVSITDRR